MQYNVFVTQFDPTGNRELSDMAREGRDIEDNSKNASYALQLGIEQVNPHCVGDVEVRQVNSDRLVRFAKVLPKTSRKN